MNEQREAKSEADLEVLRQTEEMLGRILNHQGRVNLKVEKKEPWWFRMVWALSGAFFGAAASTLLWVWTGKLELEVLTRAHFEAYRENAAVHVELTNHTDHVYSRITSRMNRLAAQSVTRDQITVWASNLERQNRGSSNWPGLTVPDMDDVRARYPIKLE